MTVTWWIGPERCGKSTLLAALALYGTGTIDHGAGEV